MSVFSGSYVSRVLLASYRWHRLSSSFFDPYRPELRYMRAGSEMAREAQEKA